MSAIKNAEQLNDEAMEAYFRCVCERADIVVFLKVQPEKRPHATPIWVTGTFSDERYREKLAAYGYDPRAAHHQATFSHQLAAAKVLLGVGGSYVPTRVLWFHP